MLEVRRRLPVELRRAKELAASTRLSGLRRHGSAHEDVGATGPTLRLSARGRRIAESYDVHVAAIEYGWRRRFGDAGITDLAKLWNALSGVSHRQAADVGAERRAIDLTRASRLSAIVIGGGTSLFQAQLPS